MRYLFAASFLLLAGCGVQQSGSTAIDGPLPAPTSKQVGAANEMGDARSDFAFRLKDNLIAADQKPNFCFSPLSVNLCLSMLLNGTSGRSRDDLAKVLSVQGKSIDVVNDGNYALVAALLGNSFTCSNSIWTANDLSPKPDFTDRISKFYRGEFFAVKGFGPDTVDKINAWTSDHTKGRIPHLFSDLDPQTTVVLVNALTFDGKWATPFKRESTHNADFKTVTGSTASVPTMALFSHFDYSESRGAAAVRMPYRGDAFSMVFILPPKDVDARTYLQKLNEESFRGLLSGMNRYEVDVLLPKFEFRGSYDLVPVLSKMGMASLMKGADLTGIADAFGTSTAISQVVHQTYIKVYEEGTQAAAATGVAGTASAPAPSSIKQFHADRPFLFALMHDPSKSVVFLGLVGDPSK